LSRRTARSPPPRKAAPRNVSWLCQRVVPKTLGAAERGLAERSRAPPGGIGDMS
jgi:hypothetical protein